MSKVQTITISEDTFETLVNKAAIVDLLNSMLLEELISESEIVTKDIYNKYFTCETRRTAAESYLNKVVHSSANECDICEDTDIS